MALVHVFGCLGRFRSFTHLRSFIDCTYTEDGDGVPSQFMRDVGLVEYEPGCIEAIHTRKAKPLPTLLRGVSYEAQWLHLLATDDLVNAAICVFEPNVVRTPKRSSLEYYGAFEYHP